MSDEPRTTGERWLLKPCLIAFAALVLSLAVILYADARKPAPAKPVINANKGWSNW
jgi:hypothetical protein